MVKEKQQDVHGQGIPRFVQNGIVVNVAATFRFDPKPTVGAESTTINNGGVQ